MFALFKWITGGLLTLCLLIALAVVVLPRVIDPNDYRDTLTKLVKQHTDRDMILEGDLSISVFPWLGVRTQGLSLSQPQQIGADEGAMIEVDTAQLRIKLVPLLSKRLEIDTVVMERPRLKLVTLANGINSFAGLGGESDTGLSTEQQQVEPQLSESKVAVALVVQGVNITDGTVLWDDRQAKEKYSVRDLNISTGNLIGDALADFDISGLISDQSDPQEISLSSRGQARINTDSLEVVARDISVELSQAGQLMALSIDEMTIDQTQNVFTKSLQVSGGLTSTGVDSFAMQFNGELASAELSRVTSDLKLRALKANLQAQLADQPDANLVLDTPNLIFNLNSQGLAAKTLSLIGTLGARPVALSMTDPRADLAKQTANVARLQVRSNDIDLQIAALKAVKIIDDPQATGKIALASFDAAQALRDFDIDYVAADDSVLRAVSLNADLTAGMDKIHIDNMQLQVDQSSLIGRFSAQNFATPELDFDLSLDTINLDRYLPPSDDAQTDGQAGSTAEALAVPMAMFNELVANGQFKAKQLTSGGIELNDIDVQINSTPGNVSIVPNAKLYDGNMGGSMVFKQRGDTSTLHVKNEIDLVSLAKFLQAAEVTDQLSGIGTLAIDVTVTEKDGLQSNSGTIKLFAKNGAIKGVDIKNIVDSGYQQYNQIRGKKPAEETKGTEEGNSQEEGAGDVNDETRFAELIGTFDIKDFIISNRDFNMKAPLFRVSGEGDIDIQSETVDYLVKVAVVNSTNGQGGEALEKLKGITLPIRFRGSMFSPSYSLDMKALYKGLVKNEVEEKKAEYIQEKLGIESDERLSTKEILRQALLNKLNKKNRDSQAEETITIGSPNERQGSGEGNRSEPDVNTSPEEGYPEGTITIEAPDVNADPSAEQTQPEQEDTRTNKQKRKDELKKLLLEGLFN